MILEPKVTRDLSQEDYDKIISLLQTGGAVVIGVLGGLLVIAVILIICLLVCVSKLNKKLNRVQFSVGNLGNDFNKRGLSSRKSDDSGTEAASPILEMRRQPQQHSQSPVSQLQYNSVIHEERALGGLLPVRAQAPPVPPRLRGSNSYKSSFY